MTRRSERRSNFRESEFWRNRKDGANVSPAMRPCPPPDAEILDEDLQIILATLETLTPQIGHLAPASSRALEEAVAKISEARNAFDRARHHEPLDDRQLCFPLVEASR